MFLVLKNNYVHPKQKQLLNKIWILNWPQGKINWVIIWLMIFRIYFVAQKVVILQGRYVQAGHEISAGCFILLPFTLEPVKIFHTY